MGVNLQRAESHQNNDKHCHSIVRKIQSKLLYKIITYRGKYSICMHINQIESLTSSPLSSLKVCPKLNHTKPTHVSKPKNGTNKEVFPKIS